MSLRKELVHDFSDSENTCTQMPNVFAKTITHALATMMRYVIGCTLYRLIKQSISLYSLSEENTSKGPPGLTVKRLFSIVNLTSNLDYTKLLCSILSPLS